MSCIVVGNKVDLIDQRVVTKEEGEALVAKLNKMRTEENWFSFFFKTHPETKTFFYFDGTSERVR